MKLDVKGKGNVRLVMLETVGSTLLRKGRDDWECIGKKGRERKRPRFADLCARRFLVGSFCPSDNRYDIIPTDEAT